jgi:hypothetical protein
VAAGALLCPRTGSPADQIGSAPVRIERSTFVRRVAVAAAAVVLGGLGFVALAPTAQADPLVCINISLDLNGTPVAQSICLPPDGAPGVPGVPGVPGLPPLPI